MEKDTRILKIWQNKWDEAISRYFKEVESLNSEPTRSHRLTALLQELLYIEPHFIEKFCAGIEKYQKIRQKNLFLKSSSDILYGNAIIDFEAKILINRTKVKNQLRKYSNILLSQQKV